MRVSDSDSPCHSHGEEFRCHVSSHHSQGALPRAPDALHGERVLCLLQEPESEGALYDSGYHGYGQEILSSPLPPEEENTQLLFTKGKMKF